jgi:hypothetical protein
VKERERGDVGVNPTAAARPDLPGHESCHKFRELSWKNSQKFMETQRLVEHERAKEDHKRNNNKSLERERQRQTDKADDDDDGPAAASEKEDVW